MNRFISYCWIWVLLTAGCVNRTSHIGPSIPEGGIVPSPQSTGVGSGGDVFDYFLETVRQRLRETLGSLPTIQDNLCEDVPGLTPDQGRFCDDLIRKAGPPLLALNQIGSSVPFRIVEKLPEVHRREVGGYTQIGPEGEIEFERATLRQSSPKEILLLMVHEMGHKIPLGLSGAFIGDEEEIGPFTGASGGRRLLDAMGGAMANLAVRLQLLAGEFELNDIFSCRITAEGLRGSTESSGTTRRRFLGTDRQKWNRYETGVGLWPGEFECGYTLIEGDETWTYRKIVFQLRINELGCTAGKSAPDSTTELRLLDLSKPGTPQILASQTMSSDPICDESHFPLRISQVLGGREITFEISYEGSLGQVGVIKSALIPMAMPIPH